MAAAGLIYLGIGRSNLALLQAEEVKTAEALEQLARSATAEIVDEAAGAEDGRVTAAGVGTLAATAG